MGHGHTSASSAKGGSSRPGPVLSLTVRAKAVPRPNATHNSHNAVLRLHCVASVLHYVASAAVMARKMLPRGSVVSHTGGFQHAEEYYNFNSIRRSGRFGVEKPCSGRHHALLVAQAVPYRRAQTSSVLSCCLNSNRSRQCPCLLELPWNSNPEQGGTVATRGCVRNSLRPHHNKLQHNT